MTYPRQLPAPEPGRAAAKDFVSTHLGGLYREASVESGAIGGGQRAADAALASLNLEGYASGRDNAYPVTRRAGGRLSPYVRHGLIDLARLWAAAEAQRGSVSDADVTRFQRGLLWQEYCRHRYGANPPADVNLRNAVNSPHREGPPPDAVAREWDESMGCLELASQELVEDGWLVDSTRRWLASDWVNRRGLDWRRGEELFFAHLLDGSRAVNRTRWATVAGGSDDEPYLFSRWDVERQAPTLCASCERVADCPIERPYRPASRRQDDACVAPSPDHDAAHGAAHGTDNTTEYAGPELPERRFGSRRRPDAVWITAESMGDSDPALAANPDLPVIFVFDEPLLRRLQLSSKRLVFFTETLADLATRRDIGIWIGSPAKALTGMNLSVTWTPVPGWRRLARTVRPVETHPWPWLHRPINVNESDLYTDFGRWCEQVVGLKLEPSDSTTVPNVIGDLTPVVTSS